jgi:UrcA family protein
MVLNGKVIHYRSPFPDHTFLIPSQFLPVSSLPPMDDHSARHGLALRHTHQSEDNSKKAATFSLPGASLVVRVRTCLHINKLANWREMMNRFTKSCAIAVALAVPALANASLQVEKLTEDKVVITYETAVVATESGRAELERKIRKMAERVCGSQNLRMAGTLTQLQANRACYDTAVAEAMATVQKTITG